MGFSLIEKLVYKLVNIKRVYKSLIMVMADLIALPLALWSAFALRLSEWWPVDYMMSSMWLFFVTPIVGVYVFMRLGLYRAVVRFMGTQAIWAVAKGVMLLALFLWSAAAVFQIAPFPRSIPLTFALVALVYVGGSRLLVRHYYHWVLRTRMQKDAVLIYGAGGAGVQLATSLSEGREYFPIGFIDDDPSLWGITLKGLPVHNPQSLSELIKNHNVTHILLAVPNATNKERKRILEVLEGYGVHVQTIPSMPEMLAGKASIEQLREVHVEELLGRDPVPPMQSLLSQCITGKVVMVTGAGGSIGSELCRQVIRHQPTALILFEMSEYNLYQIDHEIKKAIKDAGLGIEVISILGSISDRARVQKAYETFSIDTVYHAAACKHVPIVEHNIVQGVTNNILGTRIVAQEAACHGVSHFILISTDKAVRPTNVMGATKRFAELILQDMASQSNTIFSMVRFGNVLGSSGSVVPLFRKQISSGGPITVTHEEITRYFMSIPEAASLVIQAGSMAKGGEVFVLDMGEPVKIVDLARRMVHLSGLEVKDSHNLEGDIEIVYTGLRPAEKLYEELLVGGNVIGTEHPRIMMANEEKLSHDELSSLIEELVVACNHYDHSGIKKLLQLAVSGYQPHEAIVDHLTKKQLGKVVSLKG